MPESAQNLAPSPVGNQGAETPSPARRVSILLISYNTRAMTLDCLRSLEAETTVPHEVIVVDNNSPDGSAAAIAAAFPEFRLIASKENLGFAMGNNIAAREARGDYLLLLNPDTVILDHAVDRLVAFADTHPAAGIWGGRTLNADLTLNPMSAFGDLTLWGLFCRASGLAVAFPRSNLFNPDEMGGWDRSTPRDVDVVQGCFFLIRRELWERMGGFDPTFVMYGEEADLCRRARAAGARPRMTPEATIIHYAGQSSRKRSDKEILVFRAKATLIRRHLPAWQRPFARFLLGLWPWSRMAGGRLLARLTGRSRFAEAARHWQAVWAARESWRGGFPPQTSPLPPAAA
jgi:GT2 family glycosyltransferase